MITEKYTGSQQSTQRATQTPRIDKQITNTRWPLTMHSILPAGCSQSQLPPQHETRPRPYAGLNPVTRASCLPSVKLGLSLTLGLPLHFTPRCLPSTKLGPGLMLDLIQYPEPAASPARNRAPALRWTCLCTLHPDASPVRYWAPDLIWASATLALMLRALIS